MIVCAELGLLAPTSPVAQILAVALLDSKHRMDRNGLGENNNSSYVLFLRIAKIVGRHYSATSTRAFHPGSLPYKHAYPVSDSSRHANVDSDRKVKVLRLKFGGQGYSPQIHQQLAMF